MSLRDHEIRPVQDENGKWDALDGHDYGHCVQYDTESECQAWIDGYNVGARENM